MGYGSLNVNVSITLYAEEGQDKIIEKAKKVFDKMKPTIDTDGEYVYISWVENARCYSEPPVYYTRNGDGYPGCYEEEIEWDEDDIKDELESWGNEVEFDITEIFVDKEYPEEEW